MVSMWLRPYTHCFTALLCQYQPLIVNQFIGKPLTLLQETWSDNMMAQVPKYLTRRLYITALLTIEKKKENNINI